MILADPIFYFKFVRDIPFKLPLSADEPAYSCSFKHVVLGTLLASLGLKVRFGLCRFLFNDLNLPESLKKIPHIDNTPHFYLEVYNMEQARWMIVDATWDKGLDSKLPISEWDGRSDTILAVKPIEILKPIETPAEFDQLRPQLAQQIKINGKFYEAFNKWVKSIRT